MTEKFMSMRNLKFLLYEVFDAASLTRYPYYAEYDRKMLDMVLQAVVISKALDGKPPEAEINFYQGKFHTFRYFFGYELPKVEGLINRLMHTDGMTVQMKKEWFSD